MNEKVSENPEFVSSERGKKLIEKWSKVLNFSEPSKEDSEIRLKTAILLEPQESYFCPEKNKWKRKE